MKRPAIRRILTWLVVLGIVGVAVYRLKFAAVPVVGHQVVRGGIVAEVLGTGTLEARVRTTVSSRIQERVAEIKVDQGDTVKAGQLLARLDDAEAKQQVAIAEAMLAAARQTMERVRADLARSEAVLTQATLHQKRLAELGTSKAAAQSDVDKAAEALSVAAADLKRSQAAIAEADGQIVVAEQNLQFRKEQLAFTEIHAPYDGLVIRRDRDPGEVMVPGASLLRMISLDELWISAWVDETAMAALAPGQPARVVFRAEPTQEFPGQVSRLGREADRETREFLVDVRVSGLPKNWSIGQRAEVFIETGRQADVVLVPVEFVVWKDGRAGVFCNAGGKARWREIALGMRGREQVAVTGGLAAGDQVVRPPDTRKLPLIEGQRIALP